MKHSLFNLFVLMISSIVTAMTYNMVQNFWTTIS